MFIPVNNWNLPSIKQVIIKPEICSYQIFQDDALLDDQSISLSFMHSFKS